MEEERKACRQEERRKGKAGTKEGGRIRAKRKSTGQGKSEGAGLFFSVVVLLYCLLMVAFPSLCVSGAKDALSLWAGTVVPALLPFLICVNVMLDAGISEKLGRAASPLARGLFRMPGETAFAFVMSVSSGYPIGAGIIASLVKGGRLSVSKGERALAFCTTSGPLFMLGAVGVGLFASPVMGWIIALSHYGGAVLNGMLYGRIGGKTKAAHEREDVLPREKNTDAKEQKTAISFISSAIAKSAGTLVMIGGYMVLCIILIHLFRAWGMGRQPLWEGLVEMTAGCRAVAEIPGLDPVVACMIVSGLISFGGLSVHAQTLSLLHDTGIRPAFYLQVKLIHGILAAALAGLLGKGLPVFARALGLWEGPVPVLAKGAAGAGAASFEAQRQMTGILAGEMAGQGDFLFQLLCSSSFMMLTLAVFGILLLASAFFPGGRKGNGVEESGDLGYNHRKVKRRRRGKEPGTDEGRGNHSGI